MKKVFYSLLLLGSLSATVYAQPRIEKSAPIEEPETVGYDKVLLLKGGKTCYLHFAGNDGLEVKMFGADRKLASSNTISSEKWDGSDLKSTTVLGAYDINNEVVVFLQQPDKKHPILYRLRINADDGKLLKEDIVATTKKGNSFFLRDYVQTQLHVVKDTKTDCYAVIFYDNLDEDADDAVKILHFDEKHNLLSTARVSSPDGKMRHISFLDAAVNGNKNVFVSTYFTGNKEEESMIYLYKLNAGETTVTSTPLQFTEDFHQSSMKMLYNHKADKVEMLVAAYAKTKRSKTIYMSFMAFIDPATLSVSSVKELSNSKISEFAKINLDADKDFSGVPQMLAFNHDEEPVVLSQEITVIYTTTSKGATYVSGTMLGNIGVTEYTADGIEKNGYMVPNLTSTSSQLGVMYLKDINSGRWDNPSIARQRGLLMQDFSHRYVPGKKDNYIVYNTWAKHVENPDNEKLHKGDKKKSKINTAYVVMRNGNVTKGFLFGKPTGKKDKNTCYMDAADQTEDGMFATVMNSKKGKSHQTMIVWATFD